MDTPKRRYRRFIAGTHYYCYGFPLGSRPNVLKNIARLLRNQAIKAIGKYDESNSIEMEDPEGSNVYVKISTKQY